MAESIPSTLDSIVADLKQRPLAAQGDSALRPLLVDVKCLAALLSTSATSIWRDLAAGKLPPPARRGRGRTRWRLAEIESWINAGEPDVEFWSWTPPGQPEPKNELSRYRRRA